MKQEREVADDRSRQLVLKDYLDQMTNLLLDNAWPREEEKPGEESKGIIAVARARTLAVLRELDGKRKGALVQFLIESRAINFISLSKADLQGAHLENTDLSNADLRGADLRNANLSSANLSSADLKNAICVGTILIDANLSDAFLCGTDLTHADLEVADLPRANLDDATICGANLLEVNFESASLVGVNFRSTSLKAAILRHANLSLSYFKDANVRGADFRGALLIGACLDEARDLDAEQLEGENPPYLCNVSLPSSINIKQNRNCDNIPQLLVEKYGMSLKEAEGFLQFAAPTLRS